ncbi:MAG: glycosyl transferase [Proteobacteria bacterium]|nr:glycosyl transferase [Pseudomonadota bacterium]
MFNPCIIIPVYNHEQPLPGIIERLSDFRLPCILIDDGSRASCAAVIREIADRHRWLQLIRQDVNRGKGSAVKAGLLAARHQGYSHAVQIDADGQHDLNDLRRFLETAEANPDAVITGRPIFDGSVPKGRYYARYLTHVWVWINTLSLAIPDSMCGYRVYPVARCAELIEHTALDDRMAFDVEILIRLYWQGVSVLSIPTRVGYPQDGISHFRLWEDNLRLSLMQARLFLGMLLRLPRLLARHFR